MDRAGARLPPPVVAGGAAEQQQLTADSSGPQRDSVVAACLAAQQREAAPNPSPAPLHSAAAAENVVFTLFTVLCQRDTGTCATDPGVPGQCAY
eukprot:SAG25_NODE_9633_length_364_cov_1.169811_1_plen_93_part_10